MTRFRRGLLVVLWTLTLLAVALGSVTAYLGPLYWLSGFLLWGTGFCTLLLQAPRLTWQHAMASAWLLFGLGAAAASLALCYFAASPLLFAGWFVGLSSVLLLLAAPQPPPGRWALLAVTACLALLPWAVMRQTSLLPSIAAGNQPHLRLLLWCGADPNDRLTVPLEAAVCSGRADLVETLLRYGADPNTRGGFRHSTPVLFLAVQLPPAQQRVRDLLLQFGADSTLLPSNGQRVRLPAQGVPPLRSPSQPAGDRFSPGRE